MKMKLSNLIEDLKKYINNLDANEDFEDFDKNLVNIRYILNKINIENYYRTVGYFIAINNIGPEDDFTRYYTPIGRIAKAEALNILDTLGAESGYDDRVEQVSEKTYEEWYALAVYSTMLDYSEWINVEYRLTDDQIRPIEDKVLKLREHLGLSHGWEEVHLYIK